MRINYLLYVFLLTFIGLTACKTNSARMVSSFNEGWTFHLGDVEGASSAGFDDSGWRKLNVPHDWAIEGEFSAENPAGAGGGALPGGIGWYRKTFSLDKSLEGKKIFIDFDGVYMNSDVWINGNHLGFRPYGYISFRYDLTPYVNFDSENVIAVRVDNSEQPNSRWYSGAGIYRNVWLTTTNTVYVDLWGTYVTTPKVSSEEASVNVRTTVKNDAQQPVEVSVKTSVKDKNGKTVATTDSKEKIDASASKELQQSLTIANPELWTLEDPYRYTILTEVFSNGKKTDDYTTVLGVRDFTFDADNGFFLNGDPVKIKGVCLHHDLGCLGSAVNKRAVERQLEIMKEMGVNGIRTSHNPPAPELLQLCDSMGFIVMDEAFDMWRKRKTTYDYSRYFNEWHERDLTDHILRDRNHPSIFMWSIGNEVLEQWTHADADTLDIEKANLLLNLQRDASSLHASDSMSVNAMLTIKLADIVKKLDPTRPVTTGNNEPNPRNHLFQSGAMDIIGFNYHLPDFDNVKKNFPGKPFIATETTSALATRGYYRMPSDSMYIWPQRWDIPFTDPSYKCSAYDNCHVPWGSTHEETWRKVSENDFVSGMYVWTGIDYLGEPTPFGFPARSSYFGIVDLAGFPKDAYYFYQSVWTDKIILHVFPHWNWQKGQLIDIWTYYNNADEAELFLNGVSQGVKKKGNEEYHVFWRLTYEQGTIKVITRKNGREVLSKEIKTAGEPAQIRLTADRSEIKADNSDLSFITVEVLDKDGNLCPNAENLINFEISDNGKIAGMDNGNQTSMESFKAPYRKAFYGKCLVVVQSGREKGKINLKATSDKLEDASITITTK
ncbi:MAG: glycoside hydrolase family 2 TIM barrel-domain containing protein [Petrimonas sp.]|nr:glycoside hydrolase family 2 TIM barrel-domain containing protein [Petrimonas sp.]